MKIAVAGVTGMVGQVMLKVLEERKIEISEFIPIASERSKGKEIRFNNKNHKILTIEEALNKKIDVILFSAGSEVSLKYAPLFAEKGAFVIDNSSAWRMDKEIKLIVPEINGNQLTATDKIIANPNCSTIQMVMVLYPLHKKFGLKRVVVSTYQSVTGTGVAALNQLENERKGQITEQVYPHQIDLNCLPHCDVFLENGYTKEEMKLLNESRKIMDHESLQLTATAVRVPVQGGHSESINANFEKAISVDEVKKILSETSGVVLQDDPLNNLYPMPVNSMGKDEVYVGRIRMDNSQANTINLWVVADNLRKGAATNAVQILEVLMKKKLI